MLLVTVWVGLVAALHAYFLVLEMVLWDHPIGRKAFGMTPEQSAATKVLAANQGLYNGFLSAGLIYGLVQSSRSMTLFFLGCVVVAGVFGAATASRKILWIQAMPAAIAIGVVVWRMA
jgi:putative membrane protein